MCLGVLLAAVPWLLVPTRVDADLRLRPPRTSAGETVEAALTATNRGALPLWQPAGAPAGRRPGRPGCGCRRWAAGPGSGPRCSSATSRAGVLQVGPATAVRSDPLGLLHRPVRWGEARELFVRPVMVVVPTLGAGRVRDLEGTPSDRVSMSDLAFHALREYVPGDDLRHVHWRSSARAGRAAGPAVPRHPAQPRDRRGRRRPRGLPHPRRLRARRVGGRLAAAVRRPRGVRGEPGLRRRPADRAPGPGRARRDLPDRPAARAPAR